MIGRPHFVVIFSKIVNAKVGWHLNTLNNYKDQRRPSSRLSTVNVLPVHQLNQRLNWTKVECVQK